MGNFTCSEIAHVAHGEMMVPWALRNGFRHTKCTPRSLVPLRVFQKEEENRSEWFVRVLGKN